MIESDRRKAISPFIVARCLLGMLSPLCVLVTMVLCATANIAAADELSDRINFWDPPKGPPQGFLCRDSFPSKYDTSDLQKENCGDGDMTLFNGLLCLSGEQRGCDAVTTSQGRDGRWWRSPRRVGWEYPKYDVSFSPDQALGVLSYVLATKDGMHFDSWLNWITSHRGKLTAAQIKEVAKNEIAKLNWSQAQIDAAVNVIAAALPERLTYCTDDFDARCTLRPGDCAIIKSVGAALGRNSDICGRYLFFDQIQILFKSIGLSVPNALSAASSFFNDPNYPLHLAAVQVLLLQKMGESADPLVLTAARTLNNREPKNPFFSYLARAPGTPGARDLLLAECPSPGDPLTNRSQWAWERPDSEMAWRMSMYWDCVFAGRLISQQ
jgi:hypothetical protein